MSFISKERSAIALSLGLALIAQGAAAYELTAYTEASTNGALDGVGYTHFYHEAPGISTTVPVLGNSLSSANPQMLGRGYAYADLGVLKVSSYGSSYGSASTSDDRDSGNVRVISSASWSDGVTILAPGYSGSGVAHVRILADFPIGSFGSLSTSGEWASGESYGLASCSLIDRSTSLFYGATEQRLQHFYTGDVLTQGNYLNSDEVGTIGGYYDVDIPFTFGASTVVKMSAGTYAEAKGSTGLNGGGSFSVSSDVDMSHSVYWDGIVSLTASDGSQITNFSATGSGGHDWRLSSVTAVPEPETYAMLLAGLGFVGWASRSRRERITKL